ncbi:hypothetical protein [Rathayibacter rathayi]|uniref:hypothetical protein n=1 Tax=Rathayibacter rathayi TaxID=33887 RepID=UPI00132299FC|nr:hypothetical protein [Rathayibacter rathayi]MWV74320.1 hypothetical protein [Rathayibacter rathayi NCPPB 2980 = VKM Ac-1601]
MIVSGPDEDALARVRADPAIWVERTDNSLVMTPTSSGELAGGHEATATGTPP